MFEINLTTLIATLQASESGEHSVMSVVKMPEEWTSQVTDTKKTDEPREEVKNVTQQSKGRSSGSRRCKRSILIVDITRCPV